MNDRVSRYRVVRFNLYPPVEAGGHYRWAMLAIGVRRGVPDSRILLDGVVPGGQPLPTLEEILEAFDSAIRGSMLPR